MRRFLEYNKNLKLRTKELQQNMTRPEKKLRFEFFKKVPLNKGDAEGRGIRIYKQKQIHNFIVDFYIPRLKLVIEIDGESHFDEAWMSYDRERNEILEWLWLKVVRFTNEEVMENFDGVCEFLQKKFLIWEIK